MNIQFSDEHAPESKLIPPSGIVPIYAPHGDENHSHIIGVMGVGKSPLLMQLAEQRGMSYEALTQEISLEKLANEPASEQITEKYISINIWDDFWDDGFVPVGGIQKTYAYVESGDLTDEECKACLEILLLYLTEKARLPDAGVKCELVFYDAASVYPALVGTENDWSIYKRWELRLENLTHELLDRLVYQLSQAGLKFNNIAINVYSES